ncbi:hypothetical protein [Allofournierella massiliensis]|uniref:Alternate signal-mediated exported protein n=1 Tax=Allofournierella massiliensis TaxID=1650663 RepID=A0A4R1QH50_9FIRM|nr:hypothetical protein [Fournierella massiliensis]TCL49178.1 alternate signal-mediated exported protein [Fournierella massiliensis]
MKHLKYIKPALIVGLLMLVVVGTTFALRTTGLKQITNTFDVGDLDTSIVEPTDPDDKTPENKDVTVTNNGSVSAYVRARIVVDVENGLLEPDQVQFMLESEVTREPQSDEIWVILANPEKGKAEWQKDEADGYYYYGAILASKQKTGKLITEVKIGSNVPDSFDVIVQSESVPAFASSWSMDEAKAAFAAAASNSNS